jgi:ACS family hexuronate transporter-like MFS transporter
MKDKMTNFRWLICSLLFFATTVNYLDRQVLSLTYKDFIAPVFGWSDDDYGTITGIFSIVYAISNLFAGKFIDRLGTKKGYLWAIFIWSLGACLHAGCGVGSSALKAVGFVGMMGMTTSVWLFLACRSILAIGEAGNFPAAIKVTAEYFPKKDRAFATSIFNAGSSVGALAAPLTIPLVAKFWGWEMSFIIVGAAGFVWMGFWMWLYGRPETNPRVNAAERAYIHSDDDAPAEPAADVSHEPRISYLKAFSLRQTWALVLGRFLTDGVWWFFLFWTPVYLSDQFGYKTSDGMGMALIFTLYAIVTCLSIYLCKIPTYMVDRRGMNPYEGRMVAMFLFACLPLFALGAQPLGAYSAWWPALLIGIACAGHQAWSANIYSVVGDMFPKSTIGTLTGIAQFAAGCGSFIVNKGAGKLFTYAAGTTIVDGKEVEMTKELLAQGAQYAAPAMTFLGYSGKPAGYCVVFAYCALAYLIGWVCMKTLVPRYKKVEV